MRMHENEDLSRFGQHPATQFQLGVADFPYRIMFFGKRCKQFSLAGNVVMHWNHDGRFDLVDHFHYVFEAEIGHRIDWDHHHVDPLHHLFLLRRKQMSDIAQMGETKAPHFINKNGVGDCAPTLSSLARYIDDGYVFHTGSYRIPGLPEGDAPQDDRIAGNRSRIVVCKVIVADGDRVSLDTGCDIEVWIRNNFGLTAGMDQKTRVAIPLDEIVT
jgi:hypothetical protein